MLWWSKDNPTLITLNDQNHPRHYHSSLFAVYTQYIYLGITMHHSVSQMFAESHPPLLLLLDCWHTQFTIMTKFSDLRNNASLISDSSRKKQSLGEFIYCGQQANKANIYYFPNIKQYVSINVIKEKSFRMRTKIFGKCDSAMGNTSWGCKNQNFP